MALYQAIEDVPDNLAYVTQKKNLSTEPRENWSNVSYYMPKESVRDEETSALTPSDSGIDSFHKAGTFAASLRDTARNLNRGMLVNLLRHTERPSGLHSVHDLEFNEATGVLRCFLWQASPFYTKAYFGAHAWHLRWFTITEEKIISVPDRQDPEEHIMIYPKFHQLQLDEDRLIIRMVNPIAKKRDYMVMAESRRIYDTILERLETFMKYHAEAKPDSVPDVDLDALVSENYDDADAHVDLVEFPSDGSNFEVAVWIFLFPLRFLMHMTLPDVRQLDRNGDPQTGVKMAFLSTFMCLVWLVVGSYAMVASLEALAELMSIPDAVIGFTVSAAGTSLPNYVASKVAAENGFGNQAVSNAFGSNTFNIMVGLGLPWLLYTSFGTGFEPYSGLPAEGILESIIILATVLLIFVVLMLQSGFIIYKWHGILFIVLYVAYIVYAIAEVYIK